MQTSLESQIGGYRNHVRRATKRELSHHGLLFAAMTIQGCAAGETALRHTTGVFPRVPATVAMVSRNTTRRSERTSSSGHSTIAGRRARPGLTVAHERRTTPGLLPPGMCPRRLTLIASPVRPDEMRVSRTASTRRPQRGASTCRRNRPMRRTTSRTKCSRPEQSDPQNTEPPIDRSGSERTTMVAVLADYAEDGFARRSPSSRRGWSV